MTKEKPVPRLKFVPEDDRRPPEIMAQIRALESQKIELANTRPKPRGYLEAKRALNREIYRLAKIGVPQDLSWRNNDGRPAFLPKDQITITVRLTPDQWAFCQRMSQKGNVSMGVRGCIDFTMAARELPALPVGLEDD